MKFCTHLAVLALAPLTLIGCDDDNDNDIAPLLEEPSGYIRVLHASPDAPAVNIQVNGDTALANVEYQTGSGFIELPTETYQIAVDALLPNDATATVLGPAELPVDEDTEYSIIALGKVADQTLAPLILSRAKTEFGAGNIRLQVLHASPDAPAVDIYLTETNADISMISPALSNVPFMTNSDLIELAAGQYQVRITPANDKTVVFDTGALSLPAGTDLMLVAVTNTRTGSSPINVLAWSDDSVGLIADINAGSEVRVVHASPDAPAVNVLLNDTIALADVPYPIASDYLPLAQGSYNVKVEPAAAPGTFVIHADVNFELNTAYTVLAINELADIAPLVLVDERRRIATEAGLRLIHASPSAGSVDIYLGTDSDISDETPAFSNVAIGAETGRLILAAGSYTVTVTPTGSQEAAIGPLQVTLEAGKLYTAIARDEVGGGLPLGLITLDDF
ncbi:DUF4397 domain-containing protein [Ferrimonas pelagia]|uniref:DUF4397 domain-containing protein n=1 Tax=Ferrimonas pelagia TaxID=1177826 RepID=A0ABP9F3F5_9GAMM